VRFLGYVDDESLPGLYARASLFVLPSLDEGFGLPALEAMACGTPVIVSNAGALPETVADAGFILNSDDPDSLSTSLKRCLNNEDLRSSLKVKGLARAELFSWQKTAGLIWNTLNEI
jgi:glycosyltransferase involved in cell wall biosynthesis